MSEHQLHRPRGSICVCSASWWLAGAIAPFVVANAAIALALCTVSDFGMLHEAAPLATLGNVTLPALCVGVPFLMGIYVWVGTTCVMDDVAHRIKNDPDLVRKAKSLDVSGWLLILQDETYKYTYEELVAWLLLVVLAIACYLLAESHGTLTFAFGPIATPALLATSLPSLLFFVSLTAGVDDDGQTSLSSSFDVQAGAGRQQRHQP